MSRLHSFLTLIFSILIAQSAGLIGSVATRPNIDTWYRTIAKPDFTPPDWVFPVVWPTLFLLMGIAAWLVYRSGARTSGYYSGRTASYENMLLRKAVSPWLALSVYGVHLLFNVLWSFLFFEWQLLGLAFIEVLFLLALIIITARLFYLIRPLAGYLMIPYIFWVSYASVLNGTIWWIN
ncbi:TspO/MBR family protein [Natronogracilivirga saccharolytica]|uniref:Tryptophan-rich sensory protein n=1 Tax=Natronogracilivirga saccharolytica TaxID=2812953 RepID=A0A8J7RK94_9BACT|nr:TspO/MBR family protein [Natronogracilivirga saccharolytica]MBP3193270.1 tryptophan-rich sensory protein [Natronogracilivirga saccharolytica]